VRPRLVPPGLLGLGGFLLPDGLGHGRQGQFAVGKAALAGAPRGLGPRFAAAFISPM
jgi:hypothetical protein